MPSAVPLTLAAGLLAVLAASRCIASELDVDTPNLPMVTMSGPGASPASRAAYSAIVNREAEKHGLPPALAQAVATIESGWNPAARGSSGEVGIMQVMPGTAAMLGFRGTAEQLADPETNIRLGVQYLSAAWVLAGGEPCTALMKYRAGHGETAMTPLSVQYCQRAARYLTAVGSPLAARASVFAAAVRMPDPAAPTLTVVSAMAPPSLLTPDEWVRLRTGHRTAADSARFWAARKIQIASIRARQETMIASRITLTRPVQLARMTGRTRMAGLRARRHTRVAYRLSPDAALVSEWFPDAR